MHNHSSTDRASVGFHALQFYLNPMLIGVNVISQQRRLLVHIGDQHVNVAVVVEVAEGLGNKQIASSLAISEHTVKFHISSILDKLGASSRTEAVTIGIRMGLVLL